MEFSDDLGQTAGIASFMKLRTATTAEELERISPDVAVVGVPLDDGQSWKTGTRFAPRSIRGASTYFCTKRYHLKHDFDYFSHLTAVDYGDARVHAGYIEKSQDSITGKIQEVLRSGAIPVSIGGDHSITYPIVRAYQEQGRKMGIVQVDAHLDLRPGYSEGRMSNGTPMRSIIEEGLVQPGNIVQIGARDFVNKTDWDYAKKVGVHTYTMTMVEENGLSSVLQEAKEHAWDGVDDVYVTFDIDAMDPASAPGTGSPTFGGFSSAQALRVVGELASEGLSGFDLVEVLPAYDLHDITSTLAARLIVEVFASLAYRASRAQT